MTLRCPHCDVPLHEVNVRARTGYLIVLDQCPQCGGIWCDRWEIFPLAAEEALRLDALDETKLAAPTPLPPSPGRCPRCTIALRRFLDPLLPADARIERCRVCDGMWLNRGELARWKQREAVRHPLPEDTIERLAAAYGATAKWPTVSNLDSALHPAEEPPPGAEEIRSAVWSTLPWIVLRILLRLVFRL